MRKLDLQTRIEIERPASEIFDFVADQTNAPLDGSTGSTKYAASRRAR